MTGVAGGNSDRALVPGTALTIQLNEVEMEPVTWLWPGRLPRGKVVLLEGDPGVGKSTLTLDLMARITKGRAFPDNTPGITGNVVLLTAEDDLADTVRPRIEAAGGDATKVTVLQYVVNGQNDPVLPVFPQDMLALQRTIEAHQAVLAVIDPFVAYLDDQVNSWSDHGVRRALAPFAQLAAETKACLVLVRHLRKTPGGPALYRGGGSIAFIAAVRIGLLIANDPDDASQHYRILAVTKNNLGPPTPSWRFHLERAPLIGADAARIIWEDAACDYRADALVSELPTAEERDRFEEAKKFLRDFIPLEGKVTEIRKAGRGQGHTDYMLDRAKTDLGIYSEKIGQGKDGYWVWKLPAPAKPETKPETKPEAKPEAEPAAKEGEHLYISPSSPSLNHPSMVTVEDSPSSHDSERRRFKEGEPHIPAPSSMKADPPPAPVLELKLTPAVPATEPVGDAAEPEDVGDTQPPAVEPPSDVNKSVNKSDRSRGRLTPAEQEWFAEREGMLLADGFSESEAADAAWAELAARRAATDFHPNLFPPDTLGEVRP